MPVEISTQALPGNFPPNPPTIIPVKHGAALYAPLLIESGPRKAAIFKSLDDGATWSEVDFAGRPTAFLMSPPILKTATVLTMAVTQANGSWSLVDFDMSSDTWGLLYGNSGFAHQAGSSGGFLFLRSNGDIVYCYNPTDADFAVFTGATWATFGTLSANSGVACGAIDSGDIIHLSIITLSDGHSHYLELNPDNSLGSTYDWTANFADSAFVSSVVLDEPNARLLFSTVDGALAPRILSGTPLVNPIWTESNALDSSIAIESGSETLQLISGSLWFTVPANDQSKLYRLQNPTPLIINGPWATEFSGSLVGLSIANSSVFESDPSQILFVGLVDNGTYVTNIPIIPPPPPPPPPPSPTIVAGPMIGGVPIAGVFNLPDAGVKCDINGRKKCIMMRSPKTAIRRIK